MEALFSRPFRPSTAAYFPDDLISEKKSCKSSNYLDFYIFVDTIS